MPLSKNYTLNKVRGLLILWMQELNISSLDPDLVDDFIHLATLDTFSALKDSIFELYGRTTILNDTGSGYGILTDATSYTNSTKAIVKTGHLLTNSDIGKRIVVLWMADPDTPSEILHTLSTVLVSVLSTSQFTIQDAIGSNISSDLYYTVLPRFNSSQLDLSGLKITKVRKIYDSLNGEFIEVTDARDFENLSKFTQKQNKIYFYQNGEIIKLYKGSNVTAYGTISLDYFGYPELPAIETDKIDLPDEHMGLVIQKAQNFILSHLNKKGLDMPVENKESRNRQTTVNTKSQLLDKK